MVVEPVSDSAVQDTLSTLMWTLTFRVSVIVRGNIPDQLADSAMLDVHSKLMGDATLDGLVIIMLPSTVSFEMLEADQPAGVVSAEFTAQYRTSLNSLS